MIDNIWFEGQVTQCCIELGVFALNNYVEKFSLKWTKNSLVEKSHQVIARLKGHFQIKLTVGGVKTTKLVFADSLG